jgi:hypothetical protein
VASQSTGAPSAAPTSDAPTPAAAAAADAALAAAEEAGAASVVAGLTGDAAATTDLDGGTAVQQHAGQTAADNMDVDALSPASSGNSISSRCGHIRSCDGG